MWPEIFADAHRPSGRPSRRTQSDAQTHEANNILLDQTRPCSIRGVAILWISACGFPIIMVCSYTEWKTIDRCCGRWVEWMENCFPSSSPANNDQLMMMRGSRKVCFLLLWKRSFQTRRTLSARVWRQFNTCWKWQAEPGNCHLRNFTPRKKSSSEWGGKKLTTNHHSMFAQEIFTVRSFLLFIVALPINCFAFE